MSQLKTSRVRSFRHTPQLDLIAIGILSGLVLLLFRDPAHRWLPALILEAIFLLTIPIVMLWIVGRGRRAKSASQCNLWVTLNVVFIAIVALLVQYLQRRMGLGDSIEVVFLVVLQSVGWCLIVFSSLVPRYRRVGFVTCCALVLFICFTSERVTIFAASFFFSVFALWHLLSNYWSKLESKALDGQSKMLPINSIAIITTLSAILCAISISWAVVPQNMTARVHGFSPFSGGDNGTHDHFARAGVGDGDMLSAGLNATTTGPVESDQFIEDDKPTMYDVNVEKNEAATEFQKMKKSRAISIDVKANYVEKIVQSEQAGRAFRTSRKPPSEKVLDLKDRISKALFLVEGSTPARFSIDSFQHFDGWDWSKIDLGEDDLIETKIRMIHRMGTPWFQSSLSDKQYITSSRAHRVKILRLKTDAVPAPPIHRSWHIDLAERQDLFEFNAQGVLCMDGEAIPSHTVIDNISDVPNFYVLANDTPHKLESTDSPLAQIPENESKARIIKLADDWTERLPEGWQQVDSIINHLRSDFTYDRYAVATEEYSDSVASFLDQRGGPAYQFASVATQILRAAGYETRLQRGFLIQDKDYDQVSRQSVVTSENLHMWPEVRLNDSHWIPVEPTPGFPIPYNHLSWWQWCKVKAGTCVFWCRRNPATLISIAMLIGCLIRFRLELLTGLCWMGWILASRFFPAQQLTATRKLIDLRCWAAGSARPSFVPATDWFSRLAPQSAKPFCHFWQVENFSVEDQALSQQSAVTRACRQIVDELSFYRIKSQNQIKANL